jgi:hypothetical protein
MMRIALKKAWKWVLGGLLGLLGFTSCEKPGPDMYGPLPGTYISMYGPAPASYETRAPQTDPEEGLSETVAPEAEVPEE